MPGAFEPYTAGPSGVVTVPCLSNPARSRIARKLLGDGSVWILVTSGSLNRSNSTRNRTSLVPKPLPGCDAFASDWSIPRTPGSVSSSHHPSPLPRATYDWAYSNRLSIQHCNVWSDGLCAKNACARTVPYVEVSGVLLLRPTTRRYEIDFSHSIIARSCSVMRRSDLIVAVGHDAVLCDA